MCVFVLMFSLFTAIARAENILRKPSFVALDSVSATLYFDDKIEPANGKIEVVIPAKASSFNISLGDGGVVLSQREEPCDLEMDSGYASFLKKRHDRKNLLMARLQAIDNELALWSSIPSRVNLDEFRYRIENGPKAIEKLVLEKEKINSELPDYEDSFRWSNKGKKMIFEISGGNSRIPVSYSYVLDNCGWDPLYQ